MIINISDELYEGIKRRDGSLETEYVCDELMKAIDNGTVLPKCNQCKYYEGVHKVQGHAPCEYHKIGGVLWNWYCSQFEADKEESE